MNFNYKNSKKQGDAGLGAAIAWFTRWGYTVCVPLTDSQEYDLVVETSEGLKRVQVKTTGYKNQHGIYQVGLRTLGGNRTGTGKTKRLDVGRVDLLYVMTDNGGQYLIPCSAFQARSILALGPGMDQFKLTMYS